MKKIENYAKVIKTKATSQKKRGIAPKNPDEVSAIDYVLASICYLNNNITFGSGDMIDGINIKDIMIINEFKPLVTPRSVKYVAASALLDDLLDRSPFSDFSGITIEKFDLAHFLECQDLIRSMFKKDASSDITAIDTLKTDVSLADVMSRAAFGNRMRSTDDVFVPIPIKEQVSTAILCKDGNHLYLNMDVDVMISQWIESLRFS